MATEVCYESKQGRDISMDISLVNTPKSYAQLPRLPQNIPLR